MARRSSEPDGMTPLQRLIVERMLDQRWEPRDVEQRGGVSHATLHRYMQPVVLKQLPRQSVLRQLADGLRLPEARVRAAAVASLEDNLADGGDEDQGSGPVGRTGDPDAMLALDDMTPEQRAQVRAYAEFIRSQNPAAQ